MLKGRITCKGIRDQKECGVVACLFSLKKTKLTTSMMDGTGLYGTGQSKASLTLFRSTVQCTHRADE